MATDINDEIPEDLEDGEIGSDEEEMTQELPEQTKQNDKIDVDKQSSNDGHNKKKDKEKKKRNKERKKERKSERRRDRSRSRDRNKSHRGHNGHSDFAADVEKAIKKAMIGEEEEESNKKNENKNENETKHRSKKRRKRDHSRDRETKKRRRMSEDIDEDEMMCVRGASPTRQLSPNAEKNDNEESSYYSDSSDDSRDRRRSNRQQNHKKKFNRRREPHPNQDPDGICMYYLQGQCQHEDCPYSHNAELPRKLELCKFYLMECCAKGDNCLYMHSDFPCKYYHTGLPCIYKDDCKFSHGEPLSENLKSVLQKHIESAPKEILGEFPRMTRESATMMIANAQMKLKQQYFPETVETKEKSAIPSLFDLNIPKPTSMEDKTNKSNSKRSRWQVDGQPMNNIMSIPPMLPQVVSQNVLSIKNLFGVLTPKQISDLEQLGIEDLNQLSQLTVIQLNQLGLTLKQINDIQLNTMSIQKLGLIEPAPIDSHLIVKPNPSGVQDLDLRVVTAPPIVPVVTTHSTTTTDVDMRVTPAPVITSIEQKKDEKESKENKDSIDIDQYRKDALKYISASKEQSDETQHSKEPLTKNKINTQSESKDVDHRVLQYVKDATGISLKSDITSDSGDTDIRFLAPDNYATKAEGVKPERRQRRSTTDDEDNNLLIDEKWYSSDEEKSGSNKKAQSPKESAHTSPPPQILLPVIEPSSVLNKLGDLSKIDISDEVTKLLNTMKNNLHENNKVKTKKSDVRSRDPRDPRSVKKSPDYKSPVADFKSPVAEFAKSNTTTSSKKAVKVSIYNCIDGEKTGARKRPDVDLRQKADQDFRLPNFGDTDLRQTPSGGGDIDFRLTLPFKAIANYTPATEINGSINSHPPIPYKLQVVDIPKPDYTDIKNTTAKSQALVDPRLRRVFRLSTEENPNETVEKPVAVQPARIDPRSDPRRKAKEPEANSLDLQVVIQNSNWYKELSTNHKILVNQQLATVTSMIKKYQQDKTPGKKFDLTLINSNPILCSIFNNLGVLLNENGEFNYVTTQDNMPKSNMNFPPNDMFPMFGNMPMDNNMMNMPPMGPQMGPMGPYNNSYSNTGSRNAPGLLGMAPNMGHNMVPNMPYNGPGPNMPFNGPGPGPNDFNTMEADQNFHRPMGRGGYNNRGNDRWNRGGRGGRDRRNYNERGNWKADRH